MDETDFDTLCEEAPPQEAKRLRKMLAEWCQGDENSFPVQLALLTRAQWRAAAMVPRLIEKSRQQIEHTLAEHRQQTTASVQHLADTVDDKTSTLAQIVGTQVEATKKAAADIRMQLTQAEAVAKRIGGELERGVSELQKAQADFTEQRQRLLQTLADLRTDYSRQEWFCCLMILAVVLVFGILIGVRLAR